MSLVNSIFGNDLARLAQEGGSETQLIGLPSRDPNVLEEANYFFKHGVTRAQASEQAAAWRRQDFEDGAVRDLLGEPPKDICNTRGLGPKRARYARYHHWRLNVQKELSDVQTKKAELESIIATPGETEVKRKASVRKTAAFLMGREQASDEDAGKTLTERLMVEQHRAEAAREALPEIEAALDVAQLRLAAINEREGEFLNPALVEIAEEAGLGKLYMQKIKELRAVTDVLFGLTATVGWGYGIHSAESVIMPKVGLPSMPSNEREYTLNGRGSAELWHGIRQSLLLDPKHKPGIPI